MVLRQTLAAGAVIALSLGAALAAQAHGHDDDWAPPDPALTGLARGVAHAQACDNAIHEELAEYDNCLRYWHEHMGADDARASVGFWYAAYTRARSAQRNGYPDAAALVRRYGSAYAAAQRRQPVSEAALCRLADCA